VHSTTNNIGIGTLTPGARLSVVGVNQQPGTAVFTPDPAKGTFSSHIHWDPTGDWYIRSASAAGKVVIQDTGGNVGIGTAGPLARLSVVGNNQQPGTAVFTPDSAKGTFSSHIHWDPTGDWYIRSAQAAGKVIIQDTGGKVGIGTPTPGARLDVNGDINYGQLTKLDVADNFSATIRAADLNLGFSGRRGSPGRALVDLSNTLVVNYSGDWSDTRIDGNFILGSSRAVKEDINNFSCEEARNVLSALSPVKFHFVADRKKRTQIGFIAEDVPEALSGADRKGVAPMNIIGVLVQVVKEHETRIQTLESSKSSIQKDKPKRQN
jgi:hypothetical protein